MNHTHSHASSTDPLWDLPTLARFLGLSPGGLRNMLGRNPGALPPLVRIGRRVRWRPETVSLWLESRETAGAGFNPSGRIPESSTPLPGHRGRPRSGGRHFP
ncbi:MAG: helix-turn-helix transcriptional regulator [Gammaproteobacteria bacterium]